MRLKPMAGRVAVIDPEVRSVLANDGCSGLPKVDCSTPS